MKRHGFSPPNYTQTPNELFDMMGDLTEAELKVLLAVVRETFGWHRPSATLSLGDLEQMTKLHRETVSVAVQGLLKRGILHRVPDGRSFRYSLTIVPPPELIVGNSDQSEIPTSRKSRPTSVGNSDHPSVGNSDHPSIKERSLKKDQRIVDDSDLVKPAHARESSTARNESGAVVAVGQIINQHPLWKPLRRVELSARQIATIIQKQPDYPVAEAERWAIWMQTKEVKKTMERPAGHIYLEILAGGTAPQMAAERAFATQPARRKATDEELLQAIAAYSNQQPVSDD